jgi:hypothetical protein
MIEDTKATIGVTGQFILLAASTLDEMVTR